MAEPLRSLRATALDRALLPLHRWVWQDPGRRALKLLRFAETEADGGRDLSRAAEVTRDPLLRRLYLRHAQDEERHAHLFRARGRELLHSLPRGGSVSFEANFFAPGERGLDDLHVESEGDESLLAFLHLSEEAAAQRFVIYQKSLAHDPETRDLFRRILHDEAFHMSYTHAQLTRIAGPRTRRRIWQARLGRLWKAYLRVAAALAGVIGSLILRVQYFVLLPPFVFLARRAARREPEGFAPSRALPDARSQY
ncbi:MAG: ferritin-like domain-containing protein [Deltaproteobacteria bacterium]|nr:MAG: ferritin-like domain-containing protein [Deltaproteobacteria bacterium]TMB36462.1 MAG: ferritin-like domain-containing protein [Deltaproteobacteria bacterium]